MKIYIKAKKIDSASIGSRPEEDMGFDYETHEEFIHSTHPNPSKSQSNDQ